MLYLLNHGGEKTARSREEKEASYDRETIGK
jgi:hypothetical protein